MGGVGDDGSELGIISGQGSKGRYRYPSANIAVYILAANRVGAADLRALTLG